MISLAQDHADHVFGAKYDDVRERYSAEIADMKHWAEADEEHEKYMQKVYEAGFGDDQDAYEASWKRTIEYFKDHNEFSQQ